MATRVPNPISFYHTSNESLLNKLSFNIKYLMQKHLKCKKVRPSKVESYLEVNT